MHVPKPVFHCLENFRMTEGWMTIEVQPLLEQFVHKKFIHSLLSQAILHVEKNYRIYWCENIWLIVYMIYILHFIFGSAFCFCLLRTSIVLIHTYKDAPFLFYSDICTIYFRKLYGRCYFHMLKKFGLPVFAV